MTRPQESAPSPAGGSAPAAVSDPKVRFGRDSAFRTELRRRVDEYFQAPGHRRRDFGIRYAAHPTVWAGIASHYRWLRRMGLPLAPS